MKRLSVLLTAIVLTVGVIASSAFTSDSFHNKAVDIKCFEYVGVQPPTSVSILDQANWVLRTSLTPTPCNNGLRLCGICFDIEDPVFDYELGPDGKPTDELLEKVSEAWAATAHGASLFLAGVNQRITIFKKI